MHTFLDNFNQSGKYSAQIASHQAGLRREEKFTDKKSLNISSLKSDYLNLDSSSGLVEIMKEHMLFRKSAYFVEVQITLQIFFQKDKKGKGKRSCG